MTLEEVKALVEQWRQGDNYIQPHTTCSSVDIESSFEITMMQRNPLDFFRSLGKNCLNKSASWLVTLYLK